ncbi:MAG TPA: carboxypeptidase-like regulatory domain-containing protein [Longimicrobium sp.]
MKITWSRHDRRSNPPSNAVRMLALGMLLLGGAAACETVASPELTPSQNLTDGGSIGGTVLDLDGRPVAGARVRTAGGAETVTDPEGGFRLSGLAATPRLAVTVEAAGYDGTTAIYEVRTGAELSRPIRIQPLAAPVVINSGSGGAVPFQGGGQVLIPANAFPVAPGTPVTVRATYIDTSSPTQFSTAPGDFTGRTFGGTEEQIESFGMLSVDVRDPQGQPLELNPGQQAVIQFPVRGGTGAATRPLWTFDPQQGVWVEEGMVTVTPTSQDATVPSLAPRRNVDVPFRPVCISVRVLRTDKVTPRPNQWVSATGISYAGFTQGWTNGNGVVQLQVRSSSQVLLQSGPAQQTVNTPPAGTLGCPGVATLIF